MTGTYRLGSQSFAILESFWKEKWMMRASKSSVKNEKVVLFLTWDCREKCVPWGHFIKGNFFYTKPKRGGEGGGRGSEFCTQCCLKQVPSQFLNLKLQSYMALTFI